MTRYETVLMIIRKLAKDQRSVAELALVAAQEAGVLSKADCTNVAIECGMTLRWSDDTMPITRKPGPIETYVLNCRAKSFPGDGTWVNRHNAAWRAPSTAREHAIKNLLVGFAQLADSANTPPNDPGRLGDDGYFHQHALDMIQAYRAALNFDCGRYDCGTLDRLILDMARMAGVEVPE